MTETDFDYNAMSDGEFSTMVREFVQANYPPELRFQTGQLPHEMTKGWFAKLSARGWIAPAWPREFGGQAPFEWDAFDPKTYLEQVEAAPSKVRFYLLQMKMTVMKMTVMKMTVEAELVCA